MFNTKDYLTLSIPKEEYGERIKKVQKKLKEREIDLGIIYATPNRPGDVMYLSGLDPNIFDVGAIVSKDKFFIIGGFETHEYAIDTMKFGEYRIIEGYDVIGDWPGVKFNKIQDVLKEACTDKIKRIGITTSKDILSVSFFERILSSLNGAEVVDATDIIADLRYIKSQNEQDIIKASNFIATAAIKNMIANLKPGLRELEVSAHGDLIIKKMGARSYGFDTILLSGARAKSNIGRASNKIIEKGDIVVIGVSVRFEGYACGIGRTLVAGGANKEQIIFLEHGIKASGLAAKNVKFNTLAKYIDTAPREYLKDVGLGQYQYYSVGHGGGIHECLEKEGANQYSEYRLPKNIIMQVDVGLFGHPQFYGARHEDPYLIDNNGETKKLTDLPMRVYH